MRVEPSPVHRWGGHGTRGRTHSPLTCAPVVDHLCLPSSWMLQVSGARVTAPTDPDERNARLRFLGN